MGSDSTIATMDSYLIEYDQKKFLYVTSVETPFALSNKKLAIRNFEIQGDNIQETEMNPIISGYHVRNIFQSKPHDETVYIVDHGIDVYPFPGGSALKINLETKNVTEYTSLEGKFNFSGDAIVYKNNKYEVFVGINFVSFYRNGVRDEKIENLLADIKEPQGFLSAVFFEMNNQLNLFLGVSDIYPKDHSESKRNDYLLNLSDTNISCTPIERSVPWDWATVYAGVDEKVPGLGRALKVTYHNPGFKEARIGFYLIDQGFKFQEVPIQTPNIFINSWIPKFEFRGTDLSDLEIIALLRPTDGDGKYGFLKLTIGKNPTLEFEQVYLIGIHRIEEIVYGLNWELKLIKI